MDPHKPYHERPPWFTKRNHSFLNLISAYDSEINYVDSHIKELFDLFNWYDDTVVIVTSDHGEAFRDHGTYIGHGHSLFNEEIRVPLLIYIPGGKISGRIAQAVSGIDILPTLSNIIGLPTDTSWEGLNIIPLIKPNAQQNPARYLYAHLLHRQDALQVPEDKYSVKAIFNNQWKYITSQKYTKLFDLQLDPLESANFLTHKPEQAELLRIQLSGFLKSCKRFTPTEQAITLGKDQIEKLKSLGYVR